jgi:predicted LPLAT superfamily acyltransferase/outer membrane lipoprotein-sorting protein
VTRSPAWARERGSRVMLRIMRWITLHLGWSVARVILLGIAVYYFLTAAPARAASREFLARARGRAGSAWDVFRHIHAFASVIMESVFLLSGRHGAFDVQVEGLETLRAAMADGTGCVLLGAHFGSFEVLRAVGRQAPVPVRPVMFRRDHGRATEILEALDPALAARVIELGEPDAMLRVREAVMRGEIVGMLADRSLDDRKSVAVPFLGREAQFPLGPLMVAASLSVPVLLFFGIRTGPRRYLVQFAPLAERVTAPRGERAAALQGWVARYAAELEARCQRYPFNWFNFYPFWGEASRPLRIALALVLLATPAMAQTTGTWLDGLMQRLAAIPARQASFTEERHIAALTTPLVSHGRLVYRRPDHLEKITTDPQPETLVVDGDRLTIRSPEGTKTFSLAEQPAIAGLVDSVRDAIAGNLAGLQRYYRIEAQGGPDAWIMLLTPAGDPLARVVRRVTITGRGTDLTGVTILQANGDEQSMTVTGTR